jgi:hypothetical protein
MIFRALSINDLLVLHPGGILGMDNAVVIDFDPEEMSISILESRVFPDPLIELVHVSPKRSISDMVMLSKMDSRSVLVNAGSIKALFEVVFPVILGQPSR